MRHLLSILALSAGLSACGEAEQAEIGASLNDKVSVAIADVPADVMAAAKAARADLTFEKAERVERNGSIYFDIEGEDADGNEIELDLLQSANGAWSVVEVQRDVAFADVPEIARAALMANQPGVEPARIIESDQGDGVIVYEFFTKSPEGEAKYEVKYSYGIAEFLTEEWAH